MEETIFPDSHYIYDKANFKKAIAGASDDLRKGYQEDVRSKVNSYVKKYKKVIMCGMGGSGICADMLKVYLAEEVEIISNKTYSLPLNIDRENDLVIISSYSGNTEEALHCYKEAKRLEVAIIAVTSGGKLKSQADLANYPVIKLPDGYQPRAALSYSFAIILKIFEELSIIKNKETQLASLIEYLSKQNTQKVAIELAQKIGSKTPLIYASSKYSQIAYRWRTQFNENSKILAFNNQIPEVNHNELNAFVNRYEKYHAIFLSYDDDFSRIKKRMKLTKDIMAASGVSVTELEVKGTLLNKIFSSIMLGDWTSYYLALLLETEPSNVKIIEKFKRDMGPHL